MKYDFCKFNAGSLGGKPAELFFYGDIVSSSWDAWSVEDQYPANVQELLKDIGDCNLDIHINSYGGEVFAGFAICNMLRSLKGKKTVYIDGLAASIASVIAMAGDEIIMPENAYLMIHKAWTYAWGNADELKKLAEDMEKFDAGIVATYMTRAAKNVTEEQLLNLMEEETWLTAKEAAELFSNITLTQPMAAAAAVKSEFFGKFAKMPEGYRKLTEQQTPRKPENSNVPDAMKKHARYLETMRVAYGDKNK